MKVSKKKKKGNRLAKLRNGGVTGDPKNTGELLAMLNAFGSNQGSSDNWFEKTQQTLANSNTFKDWSSMPVETGFSAEQQDELNKKEGLIRDKMASIYTSSSETLDWDEWDNLNAQLTSPEEGPNTSMRMYGFPGEGPTASGPPIDLAIALGLAPGAVALKSAQTIGEFGYSTLAPWASTVFQTPVTVPFTGGAAGVTLEGGINALFASHGMTHLPENVSNFVKDPSWGGFGKIGMNLLEILPATWSSIKNLAKGGESAATIKLADSTSAVETSIKEQQYASTAIEHVNASIKIYEDQLTAGIITREQFETAAAKVLSFQQEKSKSPGYIQHLVEGQRYAYEAGEELISGTGILTKEAMNAKKFGVEKMGYFESQWIDEIGEYEQVYVAYDDSKTAMLKLVEIMTDPKADGVLKKAVGMTQQEIGASLRGLYTESKSPYWKDVYSENSGVSLSYLESLSPEELLRVLAHEDNHARRVAFMRNLTDQWAVQQFTMVNDINPTMAARHAIKEGTVRTGSDLQKQATKWFSPAKDSKTGEFIDPNYATWENDTKYLLEPVEVIARLDEIQITWWNTAEGANMSDWMYKWTPELAMKAYNNWNSIGPMAGRHPLITLMKGTNEKEKFISLAKLMNNILSPAAAIIGVNQVTNNEAVADPEIGAQQYKQGGFIAKKFRPRGMNLRKSN